MIDTVSLEEHEDGATIVWLIGEAFRLSRRWTEEVVREHGITATQLSILKRLDFFPGISRAELARQTFISSQAAQVALSTLEQKGLVAGRPTRNSRAVRTQLTAKGRRVLAQCSSDTEPVLEKVVAPFEPAERKELISLLRRMVEGYGVPIRP
jgi:DNA-binding MarR family transcriptional regulator